MLTSAPFDNWWHDDVAQGSLQARFGFVGAEKGAAFWQEAALAVFTAICTSWLGLLWGNWMQRIRR